VDDVQMSERRVIQLRSRTVADPEYKLQVTVVAPIKKRRAVAKPQIIVIDQSPWAAEIPLMVQRLICTMVSKLKDLASLVSVCKSWTVAWARHRCVLVGNFHGLVTNWLKRAKSSGSLGWIRALDWVSTLYDIKTRKLTPGGKDQRRLITALSGLQNLQQLKVRDTDFVVADWRRLLKCWPHLTHVDLLSRTHETGNLALVEAIGAAPDVRSELSSDFLLELRSIVLSHTTVDVLSCMRHTWSVPLVSNLTSLSLSCLQDQHLPDLGCLLSKLTSLQTLRLDGLCSRKATRSWMTSTFPDCDPAQDCSQVVHLTWSLMTGLELDDDDTPDDFSVRDVEMLARRWRHIKTLSLSNSFCVADDVLLQVIKSWAPTLEQLNDLHPDITVPSLIFLETYVRLKGQFKRLPNLDLLYAFPGACNPSEQQVCKYPATLLLEAARLLGESRVLRRIASIQQVLLPNRVEVVQEFCMWLCAVEDWYVMLNAWVGLADESKLDGKEETPTLDLLSNQAHDSVMECAVAFWTGMSQQLSRASSDVVYHHSQSYDRHFKCQITDERLLSDQVVARVPHLNCQPTGSGINSVTISGTLGPLSRQSVFHLAQVLSVARPTGIRYQHTRGRNSRVVLALEPAFGTSLWIQSTSNAPLMFDVNDWDRLVTLGTIHGHRMGGARQVARRLNKLMRTHDARRLWWRQLSVLGNLRYIDASLVSYLAQFRADVRLEHVQLKTVVEPTPMDQSDDLGGDEGEDDDAIDYLAERKVPRACTSKEQLQSSVASASDIVVWNDITIHTLFHQWLKPVPLSSLQLIGGQVNASKLEIQSLQLYHDGLNTGRYFPIKCEAMLRTVWPWDTV
jgi:hypothetical protein